MFRGILKSMTIERVNYSSGTPWEPLRGYSRAVKIDNHLYISGTTSTDEKGDILGGNDAYDQTRIVITFAKRILQQAGFSLSDVYRTRMYVTNMSKWDEYARAHREAFEEIRPASSIVQVQRLTDPRLLVEMEFEAVLGVHQIQQYTIKR